MLLEAECFSWNEKFTRVALKHAGGTSVAGKGHVAGDGPRTWPDWGPHGQPVWRSGELWECGHSMDVVSSAPIQGLHPSWALLPP